MILISYDVAKGKQVEFKEILMKLGFKDHIEFQQTKKFMPESTMVLQSGTRKIEVLNKEIQKDAAKVNIEIERLVLLDNNSYNLLETCGSKLGTKRE